MPRMPSSPAISPMPRKTSSSGAPIRKLMTLLKMETVASTEPTRMARYIASSCIGGAAVGGGREIGSGAGQARPGPPAASIASRSEPEQPGFSGLEPHQDQSGRDQEDRAAAKPGH